MKKRMMSLLLELLKDSKRSDRELARVLEVSQPTITRMRSRLVKEGVIKEWTIIPDFVKMGYEILAITCIKGKWKKEFGERAVEWAMANPDIIFVARAEGMGKNAVVFSVHKNYAEYSDWLADRMTEWADALEAYDTILISLGGRIIKPLSLKYLAEVEEK